MNIRYFRGMSIDHDAEIGKDEAENSTTWIRATFDDDETLLSQELFDHQRPVRVDYYTLESAEGIHTRHPGVHFALWRTLKTLNGYIWKHAASYDADGSLAHTTRLLLDNEERDWMQIERNPNTGRELVTKYFWEDEDTLRYSFEYNADGTFSNGYDIVENDHIALEDVIDDFDDPAFYRTASALPKALAGTSIPDEPR
jgi:outer membrane protein assembly factor BamA